MDITLLEYRTAEPRRVNPLVLARLVGVGAQVVSVTCTTRTLEDVYAQAVGEEDRSAFAVAANDSK